MCDARRISARGVSLGVQRHVLDKGDGGRENGNGTRECGSTDFWGWWRSLAAGARTSRDPPRHAVVLRWESWLSPRGRHSTVVTMLKRVAVLSDIHGVLPALEAVLDEPEVCAAASVAPRWLTEAIAMAPGARSPARRT
jgi:hypothetical protein